ncbi:MAG: hypothetical protein ABR586_01255 [Thermoplasmatota archaeon]
MRSLTAALAILVVLAGCASPPSAPATTSSSTTGLPAGGPANTTLLPETPARLELLGCRQLHTFFPFPVTAMQALGFAIPEGFTLATSDPAGALADVFVGWWFCRDGQLNHTIVPLFGSGGSMLVAVHVTPPTGFANASVDLDLYGLTWLLSSTTAARYLQEFDGLDDVVEAGEVVRTGTNEVGPVVQDSGRAAPSFGTFGVDTAVQVTPRANPLSVYRLWQAPDGKATGYLEIANQPGETVGMGAAGLRFAGDPTTGAPPFIPGTAHVVDGVDVHLVPRPLPQA